MIDKETKYDRQLRLWASTGQSNLELSHICLVNATTTGSEILKNLILPGIGNFTVVDDKEVGELDLSSNFFLKRSDIHKRLAVAITKNLLELNPDVKGFSIDKGVKDLSDDFWDQFNVVIISDHVPELTSLVAILWQKQIPIIFVNTIGFYGSINLISHEITVVETHDPLRLYDLRIDKPWPQLKEYIDLIDLDQLDNYEHAHVPYIVIFIKALELWKQQHGTNAPANYKEKELFKKLIESMLRNIKLETNFSEAYTSSHRAFQKTQLPSTIVQLFENPRIEEADGSNIFWIYLKALRNFIELNDGQLPLPGTLPDMSSHTENYLKLQKLYQDKSQSDKELFTQEVAKILSSLGKPAGEINHESISTFCKNSQSLFVTQGTRQLYSEKLVDHMYGGEKSELLPIYFAILTYNNFIDKFSRQPVFEDLEVFIRLFQDLFEIKSVPDDFEAVTKELLIHNTHSYHNLNSLMGGIASQEVLKLTTGQYTPLDNVFVFDGVKSDSHRWKS